MNSIIGEKVSPSKISVRECFPEKPHYMQIYSLPDYSWTYSQKQIILNKITFCLVLLSHRFPVVWPVLYIVALGPQ